jgi:3-hydroxypropanoate dehydrogenase
MTPLTDDALDALFREARSHNGWQNKPVAEETLVALWDLVKMGPTSANCLPARIVFVTSDEGRERLKPHLMDGNVAKTMAAPVTAIIGFDMEFYNHLPELFPHADAKSWFVGNDQLIYDTAFRNSTLQGGYLIMAARALGLNCGPMSGFNAEGVTKEFFAGTSVQVNFLCNIGYGNDENLFPRSPRPDFEKFCSIV